MASRAAMDAAAFAKFLKNNKNHFDQVLDKLKILSYGNGKCSGELKIDQNHTNPMGTLHGGLSATLVDCISSYALMSDVGLPHVSTDIHMSYLKPGKIGDEVVIQANIIRKGTIMAFLECSIKNKTTGDILVNSLHTKYIVP